METLNNTMAASSWPEATPLPLASNLLFYGIVALLMLLVYSNSGPKATPLPLVNPKGPWELTSARVRKEWLSKARDIIAKGVKQFPGKPFNMMAADVGLTTVLPPEYANEIRNNPDLSFVGFMAHVWILLKRLA